MSEERLRVGVIGAGVGVLHLEGYAKLPRVEIAALAGLDDARVQELAARFDIPQTYHDYEDLLAAPDIDAVSVCVPNALHAPMTIAALEGGKHVLVEKPLADTPEAGAAMIAAAEANNRVLMVSFNHRYRGDVQWIKRYIETGALGRIYYAKAHWMRRAGIPQLGSWFGSKQHAGGGPLIDLGVHMLDMALYLLDEPAPVAVSGSTYSEFGPRGLKGTPSRIPPEARLPYDVEDLATAFIRLDSGATLLLEASWATHGPASDDFGVTLYGTEGGVELLVRNYSAENTVRVFTDLAGVPADATPRPPRGGGHIEVVANFVAAILDGAPPIPSAADGLRCAQIIAACYQSAAARHEVMVNREP